MRARVSSLILLALLLLGGCGGNSPIRSNAGVAPPAAGSGGSGAGGGTPGGGGGSGGQGSTPATFLYGGLQGGGTPPVRGYRLDENAATLNELAGSPFGQPSQATGALAVSKSFVYSVVQSDPVNASILAMRADASSGALTQMGTTSGASFGIALLAESSGRNLYARLSEGKIASFKINSDGSLTSAGPIIDVGDAVSALAISPDGQFAYALAMTAGPGPTAPGTPAIILLNRNSESGTLTVNRQVSSDRSLELRLAPSGRYLLGVGPNLNQISVYAVDASNGSLTPVPGSPFVSAGEFPEPDFTRTFALSPDGKFVYAFNFNGANAKPVNIWVLSLDANTGALARVQTFAMGSGVNPAAIEAQSSVVIAASLGNPSNVRVLRRDATTGLLSAGGSAVTSQQGVTNVGVVRF